MCGSMNATKPNYTKLGQTKSRVVTIIVNLSSASNITLQYRVLELNQ